jgi:hypothetical protein
MKEASLRPAIGSLLSLFVLASLLRCVTTASTTPRHPAEAAAPNDLAAPLAVALDFVDRDHKATLVAAPGLGAAARAAAVASRRTVIDPDAVTQTAEDSLPPGYLRLDSVTVAGDEARVQLWSGPIVRPKPGEMLLSCGTGLRFQLKRETDGTWTISSRGITVC